VVQIGANGDASALIVVRGLAKNYHRGSEVLRIREAAQP
jgi:hypothetical protein